MEHKAAERTSEIHQVRDGGGAMEAIETTHKRIEVLKTTDEKYSIKVWLGDKIDAQYGFGSEVWANGLAKVLASNDDVREYLKQSQDLEEKPSLDLGPEVVLTRERIFHMAYQMAMKQGNTVEHYVREIIEALDLVNQDLEYLE